jgi:hypothetical protein
VSPEGHGSASENEEVGVASPSHTIESKMLGDEFATSATEGTRAAALKRQPHHRTSVRISS